MCETEIRRHVRAKEAAVIEADNGREDRVVVQHPCIANNKVILVGRRFTDDDLIGERVLYLSK